MILSWFERNLGIGGVLVVWIQINLSIEVEAGVRFVKMNFFWVLGEREGIIFVLWSFFVRLGSFIEF